MLEEINALLKVHDLPKATELHELVGSYVNPEYTLPNGKKVKFLNDADIYLGCQIAESGMPFCVGVAAGNDMILISRYGKNGSDPELAAYKKR